MKVLDPPCERLDPLDYRLLVVFGSQGSQILVNEGERQAGGRASILIVKVLLSV